MTANWRPEPMMGPTLRLAQDLHEQLFVQAMLKRRYSQLPEAKNKTKKKSTSRRLFSKQNTSLYLIHTNEQKKERQRKSG